MERHRLHREVLVFAVAVAVLGCGCGNRDVSSPHAALRGHWRDTSDHFYFPESTTVTVGRDEIADSFDYRVLDTSNEPFSITIEAWQVPDLRIKSVLVFSEDRRTVTMRNIVSESDTGAAIECVLRYIDTKEWP